MRQRFFIVLATLIFCLVLVITATAVYAAHKELVIRQAMEDSKGAAAVEAYLEGNILEVKVSARMTGNRPSVENTTLNGPGIGVLIPDMVKTVYASLEEEAPYETSKIGGFISFVSNKSNKKLKGGVSRKLFTFVIPVDKIRENGKYYLRVKINSEKQKSGSAGKRTDFKFYLDDLYSLCHAG